MPAACGKTLGCLPEVVYTSSLATCQTMCYWAPARGCYELSTREPHQHFRLSSVRRGCRLGAGARLAATTAAGMAGKPRRQSQPASTASCRATRHCGGAGMKTDWIRTDITDIVFIFIFVFEYRVRYG